MKALCLLALAACAAKPVTMRPIRVTFDRLRYPVSMSEGLMSAKGPMLSEAYATAGRFSDVARICTGKYDPSDAINKAIAKAGGDAAVRLEIAFDAVNECADVQATAEIVKLREQPAPELLSSSE
jgi:hypothetical protein